VSDQAFPNGETHPPNQLLCKSKHRVKVDPSGGKKKRKSTWLQTVSQRSLRGRTQRKVPFEERSTVASWRSVK